jgi:hypothetical protein
VLSCSNPLARWAPGTAVLQAEVATAYGIRSPLGNRAPGASFLCIK